VVKGEAVLDAMLLLLHFLCCCILDSSFCEEQEKARRELGRFVFVKVRRESSLFLLPIALP
jgi:hypothetical protein